MKRLAANLICIASLMGCVHHQPPGPYASVPPADALAILQQRAAAIHTISAQGLITLTRSPGVSIRLDGALVARMPSELHLRAWKLNRTVFDLVLTPGGLWMLSPSDPRMQQHMQAQKTGTIQFARAWRLLTHDFFLSPALATRIKGENLLVTRDDSAGKIICTVDRSTLTPGQFVLDSPDGKRQLVMRLEDYKNFDGIPYPTRIIAQSHFGRVEMRLREIHLNAPLSLSAFIPSPRAERLP